MIEIYTEKKIIFELYFVKQDLKLVDKQGKAFLAKRTYKQRYVSESIKSILYSIFRA